ncbi:hypothetical protein BDW02DRAFT_640265 [Decorospora gaudefroyi]|uniref:Altered inheritance of mitochondria protein 32 n=1 Tax=Decorospora gaudefroyi TaxID=184978 RepID=A0A6A5K5X0_9PLEO|nr:hypothetical protein BDW02DRAFT_640265 [Decorospora gaudefroyi]
MSFARLPRAHIPLTLRSFSTARPRFQSTIPHTRTCPAPSCKCGSTPPDLDIDRKTPLLNTMALYSEQVILCTGKSDWASNLEQESGPAGEFARLLKGAIGKGSPGFDPITNVLITASSLPPASEPQNTTTALLLPSFKPQSLHPAHTPLSPPQKANLLNPSKATTLPPPQAITTPTILICGHGVRDQRCGILGPLLQTLVSYGVAAEGPIVLPTGTSDRAYRISGHKFAGYVYCVCAAWVRCVGRENVGGVGGKRLVEGRVIGELLRGGCRVDG